MTTVNQYSFDVGFALSQITPVDFLIHVGYKVIHKTNFYFSYGVGESISFIVYNDDSSNSKSILDSNLVSITFMDLVVKELDFLLNSNDPKSFTDMIGNIAKLDDSVLDPISPKQLIPMILRLKSTLNPVLRTFKNHLGEKCLLSGNKNQIDNLFQYNEDFKISSPLLNNNKRGYFLQNPNYPLKWSKNEQDNFLHFTIISEVLNSTQEVQSKYFKYREKEKDAINHLYSGESEYLINFLSTINMEDYQFRVHFPFAITDFDILEQFKICVQLINLFGTGFTVYCVPLGSSIKVYFESEDESAIKKLQTFKSQLYISFEDTHYSDVNSRNLWFDHYISHLCTKVRLKPGNKKQSHCFTILSKKHFITIFLTTMIHHFSINNLNINAYESV